MAVSAVTLKFVPLPWFWIGLVVSAASFAMAVVLPQSIKLAVVVTGSLPIAVSMAELVVAAPPRMIRTIVPSLDQRDSLVGWRPVPSQVSRATATADGKTVYDVVYSIDQTGHRLSPPDRGRDVDGCVFFFADSFIFGEGVSDDQTLPYQVGIITHGRFHIVNFGFSGYGAEHMLAVIERGELTGHAPCEPTHIFYAALPHHVLRAAGKTEFSVRGPRYALRGDGTPEYVGTNPDETATRRWQRRLNDQLSKSRVYRAFTSRPPQTTQADLDLYFAVVQQ